MTGQRLILHDQGMEDKETSTYIHSGQSLTRKSRGRRTTKLRDKGATHYTQYDPSGCVGIMQTEPYAMNLCLWRTISHIPCYPLLFIQYLLFHNTGLYNYERLLYCIRKKQWRTENEAIWKYSF